ncbi:hypothetical protein GCM10020331_100720 [Ectobacillus funiculus]
MVIADSEAIAAQAVSLIRVTYRELPVVNSPLQAYQEGAPLVHEQLQQYKNYFTSAAGARYKYSE